MTTDNRSPIWTIQDRQGNVTTVPGDPDARVHVRPTCPPTAASTASTPETRPWKPGSGPPAWRTPAPSAA